MAGKTKVSGVNGAVSRESRPGVARNLAAIAHDVVTLAELQAQLARLDMKTALKKMKLPVAVLAVGAVLFLASIPLALVTVAHVLIYFTSLASWAAYLIVVAGGFLLGGLAMLFAISRIKSAGHTIDRSSTEFSNNVKWIKLVLRQQAEAERYCRPDPRSDAD
jgi:uncharacterized integral membrane protein